MDVFDIYAKISLDTSEYDKGLDNAGDKANIFAGVLSGNLVSKGIEVAIIGLKKLGEAAVNVFKESINAYSDYQQYVGGIETLFKESSDEIIEYANEAYKTAGISANEYMQLVTSFSGALLKSTGQNAQTNLEELQASLDAEYLQTQRYLTDQYDILKESWDDRIRLAQDSGYKEMLQDERDEDLKNLKRSNEDQLREMKEHNKNALEEAKALNNASTSTTESVQRAAQLSQIAISDMADMANKYGKTVAEVSQTYTSIAKGNYQTLDNLFGGMFAGTKDGLSEMLRYAERYRASLGETVRYSETSYADIVSAIHDVSVSLGVYGTTNEEAEKTVSGSLSRMKSAWKNLVAGLANDTADMDKLIADFVESAGKYLDNLLPVAERAFNGLIDVAMEMMPEFAELGVRIVGAIAKGILSIPFRLLGALMQSLGFDYDETNSRTSRFAGGRASGGYISAGSTYLVGERGPELITATQSGYVHNARETAGMLGGVHITIQGDVYDDERSMKKKFETAILDVLESQVAYG